MGSDGQYNRDIQFIKKIDGMLERRLGHAAYVFAFAACLLAHILYTILFYMAGVSLMVLFNVFSVIFYVLTLLLVNVVKEKMNLVYATIAEIVLHASFATACVGPDPNFSMFLLMIIPLAFLMPNKNKHVPFIILFVSVPLYGALNYYYGDAANVPYEISRAFSRVFYVINFLVGSAVLIFFSIMFSLLNRYIESKLRVQTRQLREMASTDPLTKLNNRREMQSRFNNITSDYVIGIADIDDFKKVNDTYGHDTGDEVLSQVAALISQTLPEDASVARWGGEEFLFLIPGQDIVKGKEYADSIINAVRSHEFVADSKVFSVTMTIGICRGTSKDDIYKIISTADNRLYKGKHNGKAHTEFE